MQVHTAYIYLCIKNNILHYIQGLGLNNICIRFLFIVKQKSLRN
jgi:hypothetical protein